MVPVDGQSFDFVVAGLAVHFKDTAGQIRKAGAVVGLEVGTEGRLHVRRQGRGEETDAGRPRHDGGGEAEEWGGVPEGRACLSCPVGGEG